MTYAEGKIKHTVGLDAHPDSFTAGIVVGDNPDEARVKQVSEAISIGRLESWFQENVNRDWVIVLEASGNSFGIYERLSAVGFHVLVLNSEQVGKIGKSYCQTDKISAVRLARVYLTGLSDEVWVPDPKTRERREVFTSYQQAVTDCTRCSNRIKSMLNGHTLRMKKGQKNLTNPSVRDLVMTAREWTPTQYSLLDEGFEDLYRANNKRNRLRKMMVREIVEDPTMLQLVRIFGIQKIAAYGLMAMIGDAYRFSSPKKLAAYFGLNPRLKQSGKIIRLFGISKRGRRDVRALLVQAAQTVVRHRSKANPLHTWAWRMLFRKDRNVAIVAIARKIAVAIWYVLMGLPFKVRERSETLVRKLRSFAKDLGKDQVRAMGFSTYNAFIENRLKLIEEFSCRGGHT